MIRVAFTMIGGKNWTGGYNYLLNLLRAIAEHASSKVQPVLFLGTDIDADDAAPFKEIAGVEVVCYAAFDAGYQNSRLCQALLLGCDHRAAKAFAENDIDVVFEPAKFYGWHFPIPAVAWIPDFQHRYLKNLFSFRDYWKREVGFRAQILSGRKIMLSSNDAKLDCERFYPTACGRTHVVNFAVPASNGIDANAARSVADGYGLPEKFFFLPNQFWKHKNHECVIEALQILKAKGRNIVIAVSGKQADPRDPEYFPRLKNLIEANRLEQNFRLLGLIPHMHIPALMLSCAALINPSTFEGWSTTVEEAKAMGTPMILSSLRVHREQVEDAQFFDAGSPEQLASILDGFSPRMPEGRLAMSLNAASQASVSMKKFADDFASLMMLSAQPK